MRFLTILAVDLLPRAGEFLRAGRRSDLDHDFLRIAGMNPDYPDAGSWLSDRFLAERLIPGLGRCVEVS
jgi:hypothetical protein